MVMEVEAVEVSSSRTHFYCSSSPPVTAWSSWKSLREISGRDKKSEDGIVIGTCTSILYD